MIFKRAARLAAASGKSFKRFKRSAVFCAPSLTAASSTGFSATGATGFSATGAFSSTKGSTSADKNFASRARRRSRCLFFFVSSRTRPSAAWFLSHLSRDTSFDVFALVFFSPWDSFSAFCSADTAILASSSTSFSSDVTTAFASGSSGTAGFNISFATHRETIWYRASAASNWASAAWRSTSSSLRTSSSFSICSTSASTFWTTSTYEVGATGGVVLT
mmetsp:Transcript_156879/g.273049  ORF Transcript_156879/g.273049 Transcript_156879/m.273049 type:complete len:219 (-) Transcript_156879:100-756(-)